MVNHGHALFKYLIHGKQSNLDSRLTLVTQGRSWFRFINCIQHWSLKDVLDFNCQS